MEIENSLEIEEIEEDAKRKSRFNDFIEVWNSVLIRWLKCLKRKSCISGYKWGIWTWSDSKEN